jgi:hypothetical protein
MITKAAWTMMLIDLFPIAGKRAFGLRGVLFDDDFLDDFFGLGAHSGIAAGTRRRGGKLEE